MAAFRYCGSGYCGDRMHLKFYVLPERKSGFLNRIREDLYNNKEGLLRRRIIPIIQAIIVFIVGFSVLYGGENVGLSDNGDFRRVLLTNNIEYADDTDHYYLFKQDYVMNLNNADNVFTAMYEAWQKNDEEEIYTSPHFLIIKISKELNVISNAINGRPFTDYNIAYMAVLYIFMLSVAAWVIFTFFADSRIRIQIAVFVLFIFVFCDAGYLLYFNSFYGEPLQYTALMMLIAFGMLIYKRPSLPKAFGFFVSLYFFAGAKLANVPYSLILAILALFIMIMRKDKLFKIGVLTAAAVCIAGIIGLYYSIPDWMNKDTTYQAVFLGILKESDDPAADLRELGVSEDYAVLANTHAYMDDDEYPIDINSEEFERGFYDVVSKADIAAFYLRHPVRLIKELNLAIDNSAYIRPPSLGNSADVPMEITDKFSGWSKLRVALRFLYEPWVIFAAFAIITLYMLFMNIFYIHNHKIESPERKYMICALDILILGLWINLVLPIMSNGEADIAKHMFLFTNCIDILFFVCLIGIVSASIRKIILITVSMSAFTGLFYIHLPNRTMEFGRLNGEPIEWEIVERYNDGSMLLMTKDCIGYMPFDEDTNDWETSDLRRWLNGGFLEGFSAQERSRIMETTNEIILTYDDRGNAIAGNHSHYWNYTRSLVADLSKTAYHNYLSDMVYIPTLEMLENINVPDSYWILCPYTSNSYMERFMNSDGFILHTDVKSEKGVRAVVRYME